MGPWLANIVKWFEVEWAGLSTIINTAIANGVTEAQVEAALRQAYKDYHEGDDFCQIVKDILADLTNPTAPSAP